MNKKAIVAMSGGVDSSVAAHLMQQAGYEVTGVMMCLFDNDDELRNEEGEKKIADNSGDARKVTDRLGIDFKLFDMREDFREEVIEKFVRAYESGQTPNPCVFCNRRMKFEELYRLGAEALSDSPVIATGHYAIIEYDEAASRYKLRKAANPEKDQSYVLYNLTQEQLARTIFPLGGLTKEEVRRIAEEQGFVTAHKKESQDICFIPGGDYVGFIKDYTGREYPGGDFVDEEGRVMGSHKGIINYTIGQRKGLGLALKKPAYVLRLDTEGNRVVLGDNEDLFTRELIARDFNWVSMAASSGSFRASARIRYKHREAPCEVIPLEAEPDRVRVIFDEPQRAITRGQSVVVYGDDYVLGGGIIE
ncbi:MAG: tRNA 2-thiouridine(34) synthase MnmA [Mogibacterium sp.]|nr:tRNA 2-thiouridine(34) synthase MnmA [Mogibacterium sp.]